LWRKLPLATAAFSSPFRSRIGGGSIVAEAISPRKKTGGLKSAAAR